MAVMTEALARTFDLVEEGQAVLSLCGAAHERVFQKLGDALAGPGAEAPLAVVSDSTLTNYHYYPFMFAPLFPVVDRGQMQALAVSGRLYLEYILIEDKLIDGQIPLSTSALLMAGFLHEDALRGLARLFGGSSPFWGYLEQYHSQYSKANAMEEAFRRSLPLLDLGKHDALSIGVGKQAIAKACTTGLAFLAGEESLIGPLEASQDALAAASQLIDDVADWRDDYESGRPGAPVIRALVELCAHQEGLWPDSTLVGQVLFYRGIAEDCLREAEGWCDKAIEAIRDLECPDWAQQITAARSRAVRLRARFQAIRTSTVALYSQQPRDAPLSLAEAMMRASSFLIAEQAASGAWSDFLTQAGESTDWVTGYVGSSLCEADGVAGVPDLAVCLSRASDWIEEGRFPGGGWGYARHTTLDADSTAACLLFLSRLGGERAQTQDIQALLTHQVSGAGFSTYREPEAIRRIMKLGADADFSGWCSSQPEVTAMAVLALSGWRRQRSDRAARAALDFLLASQSESGWWEAYWWDGRIYSTSLAVRALLTADPGAHLAAVERAVDWMIGIQRPDGGWNNGVQGRSAAFQTALALLALVDSGSEPALSAAERGANWLLRNQLDDGSWKSCPILRVPDPDDLAPWTRSEWRTSNKGTGILVRDHRRVFTTATAFAGLARYATVGGGGGLSPHSPEAARADG
jgi:squalene-hopene/tetraprenyl-beta-curcumene cyclase